MPQYHYSCECGARFSEFRPMSQAKCRPTCQCGKKAERDFAAEHDGYVHVQAACWPMVSEAMAVHPDQRAEAMKSASEKGVPTDFDSLGRPVFTSAQHRKRYCEKYGYHAKNASYSDPQPQTGGKRWI